MSSVSAPENVTAPANVTILRRPSTLKYISQPETKRLALKWVSHYPANPLISLVNPLILTFSRANNDSGSHYGEWDKVDKDMTDKDKVDKDEVEFLVPSRGPF